MAWQNADVILDSASFQFATLQAWSGPLLILWLCALIVGCISAITVGLLRGAKIKMRARADESFRDLNITLGRMPMPLLPPSKDVDVQIGLKMSKNERALLNQIMGMIAKQPDAFCGDGHGVGLYEHTKHVLIQTARRKDATPDLVLAAAAHDLGKLTSFEKNKSGVYEAIRLHSNESARLLGGLPAWWALPELQRETIRLAVKYDHAPERLPEMQSPAGVQQKARDLIDQLRKVDQQATKEEKEAVKETIGDISDLAVRAFIDALSTMPMPVRGAPPGSTNCALKKGNRILLFEGYARDHIMNRLKPEYKAALGGKFRKTGHIAEFTYHLMKVLDERGWLVTRVDSQPNPEAELEMRDMPWYSAFWDVLSGTQEKKGLVIIDLPQDMVHLLPAQDTFFKITYLRGRKVDVRDFASEAPKKQGDRKGKNKAQKERHGKKSGGQGQLESQNKEQAKKDLPASQAEGAQSPQKPSRPKKAKKRFSLLSREEVDRAKTHQSKSSGEPDKSGTSQGDSSASKNEAPKQPAKEPRASSPEHPKNDQAPSEDQGQLDLSALLEEKPKKKRKPQQREDNSSIREIDASVSGDQEQLNSCPAEEKSEGKSQAEDQERSRVSKAPIEEPSEMEKDAEPLAESSQSGQGKSRSKPKSKPANDLMGSLLE